MYAYIHQFFIIVYVHCSIFKICVCGEILILPNEKKNDSLLFSKYPAGLRMNCIHGGTCLSAGVLASYIIKSILLPILCEFLDIHSAVTSDFFLSFPQSKFYVRLVYFICIHI